MKAIIFIVLLLPVYGLGLPRILPRPLSAIVPRIRPGNIAARPLQTVASFNPFRNVFPGEVDDEDDDDDNEVVVRGVRYGQESDEDGESEGDEGYESDGDRSLEEESGSDEEVEQPTQGGSRLFPIDYMLYTRQNKLEPDFIGPGNLGEMFMDGSEHEGTIFIIHGFTDSGYGEWVQDMKDELLKAGNYNVIVVNWQAGAGLSTLYFMAARNTRSVGQRTAQLIQAIFNQKDVPASLIHMIGHSLGAHCSGFTGKEVKKLTGQTIGRISGLDPAGPLFINLNSNNRLDRSDADFVDIIHTNDGNFFRSAFGWKKNSPLGHVDFYPNGGSLQAGCPRFRPGTCSHNRAPLLFTNSIRICQYQTRQGAANCPDGPDAGVQMGFYAKRTTEDDQRTYCLETSGSPPYCGI